MRHLRLAIVFLLWSALFSSAQAQPAPSAEGRTALWTSVGAGAGFGVGLWAGLTAYDDAINSDRKVWTSAIIGAAAGGTLAYLLTRARRHPSPSRKVTAAGPSGSPLLTIPPLSEGDVRALAASTRLRR
jgi:ABC-type Fe3+-siderophore transport system permease subunit